MKKCLALLTVTLAVTGAGGQSIPASQSRVAGRFVAYNYGLWNTYPASISPATGSQTFTVINSYVNLGDGRLISPYSTNAPLRIGTETVTPSAVANCFVNDVRVGVCQITVTFTLKHTNSDKISSATFGLQEALNDAGNSGGGPVTVDSAWANAGGTTDIVSAAIIPAGTSIEDVRNGTTSGSGTVSGQTSGKIPLATGATVVGAPSHLDDGLTTPSTITSSTPIAAPAMRAGTFPVADIVKYGAVIDGVTPIDTALTAAFATACTTGGKVLLSCGWTGNGCYLANGSLMKNPCAGNQITEVDLRGQLVLGSTLVLNAVALRGGGGATPGSFHYAGPSAAVIPPQAHGTVGGSISPGTNVVITPAFALGTIANFNVDSVISLAGTSTCDINSITSLANIVTIVTNQSCRFNPGTGITLVGVTDSSFNGTYMDYTAYPTIPSATSGTYTFHLVGADRSSSGGTVTGLNSDSFEEDHVCAVNSGAGTVTLCTVLRSHVSADLWGMGAISTPANVNGQLSIENITLTNAWGVGLLIDRPSFYVHNVFILARNVITSLPVDVEATYGTVKDSTFFAGAGQTTVGGYPDAMRLTQPGPPITDAFGFIDFDNVEFLGGVFITCQGLTSPPCKIGDVKFHNHVIFEQVQQAGVMFDPRNLGTTYPVKFDNAILQDLLPGQTTMCLIDATDATIPGASSFTSFSAQIVNQRSDSSGCVRGAAYKGAITTIGLDYSNKTPVLPLTGGTNALGSIIAGKQAIIDDRDGGLAPAVQVYPYGSLNVNQNFGTMSNNGCTITPSQSDPQGGTQAANVFSAGSNGWVKGFTGPGNTVTTSVGDWFIYGAWFNGGTFVGTQRIGIYSSTDGLDGNAVAGSSRDGRIFEQAFVNDWWHPVIGIAQVTSANASLHNIAVQIGCANGTGTTAAFPFIVQIPASVSSTEVERIRQTMYHGIVPPGAIAAQASSALPVNLPADPTTATQAATKNYVDAHASVPNAAYAVGDLMCAQGGDTTIGTQTITAGSSTVSTITVTVAAVPNYMYAGQLITVNNASPSDFNVVSAAIVSTTSTTITYTSANNPGAWSSGGTIALACANATDAISATPYTFANKFSIPANSVAAGSTYKVASQFAQFVSATAAGLTLQFKYNATTLYTNGSGALTPNGSSGRGGEISWDLLANSTTLLTASLNSITFPTASGSLNTILQPVPVVTTGTAPLQLVAFFAATGVVSGTYTSGGSITGTVGQTCTLATFNNSSTATATVALTGTNTIAGGTALVITARGNAATAAPTTATLGSGTATCSGTATIVTVLGGAPGNATLMYSFVERP